MTYEIEMKAVLTQEQYENLQKELPRKMKLINQETVKTHIFLHNKNDIRLRCSDKRFELVHKRGKVTETSRKETTITLNSKEEFDNILNLFKILEIEQYPSWIKHEKEFEYQFNGFTYNVSLQHIENYEYILEVEFVSDKDDKEVHEPNIKAILKELGLEPVDSEQLKQKILKYIAKYQIKDNPEKHNFYKE